MECISLGPLFQSLNLDVKPLAAVLLPSIVAAQEVMQKFLKSAGRIPYTFS